MPRTSSPALLLGILMVAGIMLPIGCASNAAPTPLRVMTYNIRHGEGVDRAIDLERIAQVIRDADADVVALQEVDLNTNRSNKVDQPATLAQLTGLGYHVHGKFMDYDDGEYGQAILSRHPIVSTRIIELPPGRHEPRTALAAQVDHPDGAFILVGVHFDWLADDTSRFKQAETLIAALERATVPVIIAGDFNDVPRSRTIDLLDFRWMRLEKVGPASTFPSPGPEREIDFVFVSTPDGDPGVTGTCRVIDEPVASDHRPVIAEIHGIRR